MLIFARCDKLGRPILPKPRPRTAERPVSDRIKARNDELLEQFTWGESRKRLDRWGRVVSDVGRPVPDLARGFGLAPSTVRAALAEARRRFAVAEAAAKAREEARKAEARKAAEFNVDWHRAAAAVRRGDACWLNPPA